jgi:hypothetical protein
VKVVPSQGAVPTESVIKNKSAALRVGDHTGILATGTKRMVTSVKARVMCPLPVVSSASTKSPGRKCHLSPSLVANGAWSASEECE